MSTPHPGGEAGPHVFRVSELLAGLRGLLEDRVGRVWVAGEISNLRRASSGHCYFTLKDDAGGLRAALFRGVAQRLAFEPEDGLEVLVYGEVTVYEPRGDLQLIVAQLEPRGQGALQLAFEQLRARLEAEGLFDPARKRPIPELPRCVGVVTSPRGAAIRDVIEVTGRRFPSIPLLIAPTRVQGAGAEGEVAEALAALDTREEVEVILLVRGGGSLEDLYSFNTDVVARAVAACRTPVVCGVGHEVDVTIADLVADRRAPTPSAAAELALADRAGLADRLRHNVRQLAAGVGRIADACAARLARRRDALRTLAPTERLAARRAALAGAGRALQRELATFLERARASVEGLVGRLDSLSPLAVLGRGYAIARRLSDGAIVRRAAQLGVGEGVNLRVAEGEIDAAVTAVRPDGPRRGE